MLDCRQRPDLERLYERTGRAAILKTTRLVGRRDVAEEIVQGVFLKLWDLGLRFDGERQAYAWVYKSCHNAGIDHLRAHAVRFEHGVEAGKLDGLAFGAGSADQAVEREWLIGCLARLDEREAQVLAFRVVDGMTQDEIAEVLGVARKTVVRVCAAIEAKIASEADQSTKDEVDA